MFDTLTTLELNQFIGRLSQERHATHLKMVDPVTITARIDPLSPEWTILSARFDELVEMTDAAYAELIRREVEARTDG